MVYVNKEGFVRTNGKGNWAYFGLIYHISFF